MGLHKPKLGTQFKATNRSYDLKPGEIIMVVDYAMFQKSWKNYESVAEEDNQAACSIDPFFWKLPEDHYSDGPKTFTVEKLIQHTAFFNSFVCNRHFSG